LSVGVGEVAANKVAADHARGCQDREAAGRRVNNYVAGLGDGADQPGDETNWFAVRVNLAVNLLRPVITNP
jgi:hypothetical protein